MNYKLKYLKYKSKYLNLSRKINLKNQYGSAIPDFDSIQYIINFLWMNRKPSYSEKYIIPLNLKTYENNIQLPNLDILCNYINVAEWCKINPTARIYLWYDLPNCSLETNDIITNTQNLINYLNNNFEVCNLIKKCISDPNKEDLENIKKYLPYDLSTRQFIIPNDIPKISNLEFYSILELSIWNEPMFIETNILENFGFKADKNFTEKETYILPVYFRVDLVRLIILLELAEKFPNYYLVYVDLDSKPIDKEFLFNQESINLLTEYGLVLPGGGKGPGVGFPYENSLHILAGKNVTNDTYMLDSIKKMLVYFNMFKIINSKNTKKTLINNPQDIYGDYNLLFDYYFALKKNYEKINLRILNKEFNHEELKNLNLSDIFIIAKNFVMINDGPKRVFSSQIIPGIIILDEEFPIREDLKDISPHGYSYDKKYLKLK